MNQVVNQPNGPDTQVLDVKDAVDAFYAACHLPSPKLISNRTASNHVDAFKCLQQNPSVDVGLVFMLMMLSLMSFLAISIMQSAIISDDKGNTLHQYAWYASWPLFCVSGLSTLAIIIGIYQLVMRISRPTRKARRRLLTGAGYTPHVRPDLVLVRNGARPTQADITGVMVSAIRAAGGVPVDNGNRVTDWRNSCLRLGTGLPVKPGNLNLNPLLGLQYIDEYIAQQCLRTPGERQELPEVLQRACELASMVEEVLLVDGVAFVLQGGGFEGVTAQPSELIEGYDLRKLTTAQQDQCRRVLKRGDVAAMLRVARDWTDIVATDTVYEAVGMADTIRLLEVMPSRIDDNGELYRIGQGSSLVCVVRVRDQVVGPDGQPLVHWLKVPQHITTPREGVAWSYGLSQKRYRPTAEA